MQKSHAIYTFISSSSEGVLKFYPYLYSTDPFFHKIIMKVRGSVRGQYGFLYFLWKRHGKRVQVKIENFDKCSLQMKFMPGTNSCDIQKDPSTSFQHLE